MATGKSKNTVKRRVPERYAHVPPGFPRLTVREIEARNRRHTLVGAGLVPIKSRAEAHAQLTTLSLDLHYLRDYARLLEYAREGARALVVEMDLRGQEAAAIFKDIETGFETLDGKLVNLSEGLMRAVGYLNSEKKAART